jgi:hypothetical protein
MFETELKSLRIENDSHKAEVKRLKVNLADSREDIKDANESYRVANVGHDQLVCTISALDKANANLNVDNCQMTAKINQLQETVWDREELIRDLYETIDHYENASRLPTKPPFPTEFSIADASNLPIHEEVVDQHHEEELADQHKQENYSCASAADAPRVNPLQEEVPAAELQKGSAFWTSVDHAVHLVKDSFPGFELNLVVDKPESDEQLKDIAGRGYNRLTKENKQAIRDWDNETYDPAAEIDAVEPGLYHV